MNTAHELQRRLASLCVPCYADVALGCVNVYVREDLLLEVNVHPVGAFLPAVLFVPDQRSGAWVEIVPNDTSRVRAVLARHVLRRDLDGEKLALRIRDLYVALTRLTEV